MLLAVGGFRYARNFVFDCVDAEAAVSIYHFNALFNNTTTIEGWEKDKVATLVRRGRIQEVRSFSRML